MVTQEGSPEQSILKCRLMVSDAVRADRWVVGQFEKTFPQGLKPAAILGLLRHHSTSLRTGTLGAAF
jgi:hypothetical protein